MSEFILTKEDFLGHFKDEMLSYDNFEDYYKDLYNPENIDQEFFLTVPETWEKLFKLKPTKLTFKKLWDKHEIENISFYIKEKAEHRGWENAECMAIDKFGKAKVTKAMQFHFIK